jgi:hypothetical protein
LIKVTCEDHGPMKRDERHGWWECADPGCGAWITDEDIARQASEARVTAETG